MTTQIIIILRSIFLGHSVFFFFLLVNLSFYRHLSLFRSNFENSHISESIDLKTVLINNYDVSNRRLPAEGGLSQSFFHA